MSTAKNDQFDALVLGGGIAGLQAALELAEQGYSVAVVEKDASIGGKMIRLSKVFPTLDCASCITTPKMAAASHHPNITLFTMCELNEVQRQGDIIQARLTQLPRYVDEDKCIGCRQCEYACPVYVPDQEQAGLSARKAIYIPFSNAIPQLALLDVESCSLCGRCAKVCPTGAVDYAQPARRFTLSGRALVLATGFNLMDDYPQRAYGPASRQPNLISSLDMERILAPHGPYMRVLRPADGKEPDSVAFIQCAGSRDITKGVPYCSRVCCMYAIKQAMLLSGALPLGDITIYYMDIRAFGKNYEQFFQNAKAMGIEFVKAKPVVMGQDQDGGVALFYDDMESGNGGQRRSHDLVVMSLAMLPGWDPRQATGVAVASDGFVEAKSPKLAPSLTSLPGVFACGTAAGPKDIVDTIVEAGHAAQEASAYLASIDGGLRRTA
ncbi:MAG: FAD-dependent oxidoreductase [Pseudomonadota bacterium]